MTVKDTYRILVVDDELSMRESLAAWLRKGGYVVETARSGGGALDTVREQPVDLVLLDIKMPGMDGLTVLKHLHAEQPDVAVVMITAYGSIETAVQAMKQGAEDYLLKPFDPEHLMLLVERTVARIGLARENERLRLELAQGGDSRLDDLVADSPPMRKVLSAIREVATRDTSVLVTGETGTGKELVARAIHALSPRRYAAFVPINCGGQAESLLEGELFGHERGAFTGAVRARRGRLEMAHGGTLFLDEVGDIPEKMQADLLRVLEERRFIRVGGTEAQPVDFRLVSATHRDLQERARQGTFRQDFFYRINVVHLELPPLRERGEDIVHLAEHFLARFSREMGKPMDGIAPEAMRLLRHHAWPGNVRELKNVLERAVVLSRSTQVRPADLPTLGQDGGASHAVGAVGVQTLQEVELHHITATLEALDWNVTRAAEALGINRATLTRKIKRHGLRRAR